MQPGFQYPMGRPPSAGSAETLILVALILQLIFTVIGAIAAGFIGLLLLSTIASFGLWFFLILALVLVVGGVLLWVGYEFAYRRVRDGNLEGARTPTLILGIIGILVGGLIPGILYLVAYAKIGDAIGEMIRYQSGGYGSPWYPYYAAAPPAAVPGSPGGAPTATPGTVPNPLAGAPPSVQCPRCGRAAPLIPQYNRYWCPSCAQYV